ncbi:MAG: UDP-N-acetylmuramate--L-alanine ligase [Syntrophomonadaceae bacterium]|jgi:UDP-N-acetylmuramate--alanine ligase
MTSQLKQWIHMVGIAGAGMSNIAAILAEQGHRVSGSDLQVNNITNKLIKMGIEISQGHSSSNLQEGVDLVVISSAIPKENCEVQLALKRNIPVLKRGQVLANIVNDSKAIAISGAHGKTTTTSMLYTILDGCSMDPTFILGGEMQENSLGAKLGKGEFSIIEADESDASFLALEPYIAIVTNIEEDHMDYYKSLENLKNAFMLFIDQVKPQGFALVYGEEGNNAKKQTRTRVISYGENAECDYYINNWHSINLGSQFSVYHHGINLGEVELSVPGKHNSLNALAALTTAYEIGLDFEKAAKALKNFKGAKRRFELIGQVGGIKIIDDYAHHPTEIKATIEAAHNYHNTGRIVVVFQPHRFSRTMALGKEMGEALSGADYVIVTDIYPAGEEPVNDISAQIVYESAINAGCCAVYLSSFSEIEEYILASLQNNDLIITVGAGDIWKLGYSLLQKLPLVIP